MKEVRIDENDYKRILIPWYEKHIDLYEQTLASPKIRELNAQLGLDYLYTEHDKNAVLFKVIDEQLYLLAKIKLGI
jgi:hypothetical protein